MTTSKLSPWLVMVAVSFVLLIVNIDFTIANIAIPDISQTFHTSLGTVKWIITGYTLTCGLFTTIGGRLGDLFGHKRIYMMGIVVFSLMSLLCGLSPNIITLIIGRFLQGIGTALCFPLCFAFIAMTFDDQHRAMALGIGNAIAGITLAIGPTIGGVILHYLSWRWFFYINVPIGAIALLLALIIIKTPFQKADESLDFPSMAIYVAGLFLMFYAINQLTSWAPVSAAFLSCIIIGAILTVIFVVMQRHRRHPFIAVDMLACFKYIDAGAIRFVLQYLFFGILIILPLYYKNQLGYSSLVVGYLLLALTLAFGISALLTGYVQKYLGSRFPLIIAMLLMAAGCIWFIYNPMIPSLAFLCLPMCCIGLGGGAVATLTETEALGCFSAERSGAAAGLFFTIATLSGVLGAAISSQNLISFSDQHLHALLTSASMGQHITPVLQRIAEGTLSVQTLVQHPLMSQLVTVGHQAFRYAFNMILWIYVAFCGVGVLLSLLLPKSSQAT